MSFLTDVLLASWNVLRESALYVLFGFGVAGLLRMYFTPESVSQYFGVGRFRSVLYAAMLGVPIPL
jgi:uncharacterized protein